MDWQRELNKAMDEIWNRGHIQNDELDHLTDYIYRTVTYDLLKVRTSILCRKEGLNFDEVFGYALNRWFNNITSHYAEDVFTSHSIVEDEEDIYNKEIDFYINNKPFDLKMSVMPVWFNHTIEYAVENKAELIEWMYQNCSKERRLHNWNKIFIVCYSSDGNHNKVKWNLQLVKEAIDNYMLDYDDRKLTKQGDSYADIIFIIK